MRILRGAILLFIVVLLTPIVLASISISSPEPVYNLGDDFKFTVTLNSNLDTSDFLVVNLVCGTSELPLYKSPASVVGGTPKDFVIEGSLDRFLVANMSGVCILKASYAGETGNSQTFEITSGLRITLEISGFVFNPGEKIAIQGQAFKKTGDSINGQVEISIAETGTTVTAQIIDGVFNFSFPLPEKIPGGEYNLVARAYDSDTNGAVLNEGSTTEPIRVRQIITAIDIALDAQTLIPGNEFIYTPLLYDQAGNEVEKEVEINLYSPSGELYHKELVKSGLANRIQTSTNFSTGFWKLEAKFEDKIITKDFFAEELSKLVYELNNETLTIKNVGNIPYSKPVKITIGDTTEVKEIILEVGEEKKYKLSAPNGEYEIKIAEGDELQELGRTLLTGKAISINELGGFLSGKFMIVVWIILILALATVVVFLYRKIRRRKLFGKPSTSVIPIKQNTPAETEERHQTSNLIEKGERQESAVISLMIKNPEILASKESSALKTLDSALWRAKETRAKVYSEGDFRIIILAPILLKTKDVSLAAINVAKTIEKTLIDHNRRSVAKINFGIGVNIGELIVESKEGKFKFMSSDNTISSAKRMSQLSQFGTLISEKMRSKTVGKVKVTKLPDKNYYKLDKVIDRTQHEEFISKFKSRMEKDKT